MKKAASAVSVVLAVAVIVAIIYLAYSSQIHPLSTPVELYTSTVYAGNVATDTLNASQGSTQQLNLTLTAYEFSPSIAIPIDSIKLIDYNSTIDPSNNWQTSNLDTPQDQSSIFNYTIGLNPIILQPNMPNSTIITLNWADNAPTGRYTVEINFGNFRFLSTQGKYDLSYRSSTGLGIILSSKIQPNLPEEVKLHT